MALASGMNARLSTEDINATIGLSMGVLSQNMFTVIVTMAIVTTGNAADAHGALMRVPITKE